MPPFPERESSILAKLKKKKPNSVKEKDEKPEAEKPTSNGQVPTAEKVSAPWDDELKLMCIIFQFVQLSRLLSWCAVSCFKYCRVS